MQHYVKRQRLDPSILASVPAAAGGSVTPEQHLGLNTASVSSHDAVRE